MHKKKKRHFTKKQLAAQRLFAKRSKAGTLRKGKRRKKGKGKGKKRELCFDTLKMTATYMRKHGYKVVKK